MRNLGVNIGIGAGLTYLVIILLAFIGWVMNIVAIFHGDFDHMGAKLVLRIVGVPVFFIGAILGWL